MNNPYETPSLDDDGKYREPLVDWKLLVFVIVVIVVPFIGCIALQYMLMPEH